MYNILFLIIILLLYNYYTSQQNNEVPSLNNKTLPIFQPENVTNEQSNITIPVNKPIVSTKQSTPSMLVHPSLQKASILPHTFQPVNMSTDQSNTIMESSPIVGIVKPIVSTKQSTPSKLVHPSLQSKSLLQQLFKPANKPILSTKQSTPPKLVHPSLQKASVIPYIFQPVNMSTDQSNTIIESSPIVKPVTKPETKPVNKPETKPVVLTKQEANHPSLQSKSLLQQIFQPVNKPETRPVNKPETRPVNKPETIPVNKPVVLTKQEANHPSLQSKSLLQNIFQPKKNK